MKSEADNFRIRLSNPQIVENSIQYKIWEQNKVIWSKIYNSTVFLLDKQFSTSNYMAPPLFSLGDINMENFY